MPTGSSAAPCPTPAVPTPRAILVGTPATVKTLERQLALAARPPVLLGCVLHDPLPPTAELRPMPRYLRDLPVLGSVEALEAVCSEHRPSLAVISLPAATSELIAAVRTRLRRIGVADRFVATIEDQLEGIGPRTELEIDLPSLIGRGPRSVDEAAIAAMVRGKTVLVTGAGGSIGSELCRIVARYEPGRLVLVDRSENALFEIDRQIARRHPSLRRTAALHDVVDSARTRELFRIQRPDVVFHAAAHKHVPMMEDHPSAAIDNNLFGTVSAADAAVAAGAERFVMVSTDKAVNPTSVMGMTKRLAELYVQHVHRAGRSGAAQRATACSMVRFGNVLGSSGSVLETWKRQIADGGPVTVTDPRMTRYFMSIPEAAALVLQAAALSDPNAAAGEVFVLDMGEPLRVADLATRFIAAHGLEPVLAHAADRDKASGQACMPIVFTGIRPGEKLFEELRLDHESIRPTRHPDIHVWGIDAPDAGQVADILERCSAERRPAEPQALVELLRRLVPEAQRSLAEETAPSPFAERLTRHAA